MADLTTETQNNIKETKNQCEQRSAECQLLMQRLEVIEKEKKNFEKKYSQSLTKSERVEKDLKEERQINTCLRVKYVCFQIENSFVAFLFIYTFFTDSFCKIFAIYLNSR